MSKTLKPVYQRKDVVAEAINKGKKIQGIKGFVPCEMKCCGGSTTMYVPVVVVGLKLGGCSSTLECRLDGMWITDEAGLTAVISTKPTFDVKTDNFFSTREEVQSWQDFCKTKEAWAKDNSRLGYGADAYGKKRAFRQFVMESGILDKRPDLKERLDAAVEDAGSVSKLPVDQRNDITRDAILYTHFPNADEDFDPENYDD